MQNNRPARLRLRRTDPLRGDDRTLRNVKTASAPHEIGDDHRKDRTIDARTDSIQQLDAYEPIGIVREWIEAATNRENRERNQE